VMARADTARHRLTRNPYRIRDFAISVAYKKTLAARS